MRPRVPARPLAELSHERHSWIRNAGDVTTKRRRVHKRARRGVLRDRPAAVTDDDAHRPRAHARRVRRRRSGTGDVSPRLSVLAHLSEGYGLQTLAVGHLPE